MNLAFDGDAALKAALLDRLRAHAAAGTLRFGATEWDGLGGSPLKVSTQGGSPADYAERFGYPIALAGALDPVTAYSVPERALETALRWVECVSVGADLAPVPARIVGDLLERMSADRLAPRYHGDLLALYRQEAADTPPSRRAWGELRQLIERSAAVEPQGSDAYVALTACATACWPLATSGSVLTTLISYWLQDANRGPDPASNHVEQTQARSMLHDIFTETQPQRDAGEDVDIPRLFRARAPALAAAFEAHLDRANARYLDRMRAVPGIVLGHLSAADRSVR